MQDFFSNIAQWSIDVVYSFGYLGIGILAILSSLNVPIPMPLILGLAGFLVGQGSFSFVLVVVASAMGAVAAALILYVLGLWFGEARLRRLIGRVERFGFVSESDLDKASRGFERHGGKAILVGHLLPVGGGLISIPAGLKRMPIWRFMLYTIPGCTLWNGLFVVLGWVLGSQWAAVQDYATIAERVTLVVLAGLVLWFLRNRWKARKQSGR